MDADEKLKFDYDQTTKYFHALAEIRFKLLGLLPVVTGTAVGVLQSRTPELVIPLSIFGLLVTFGLMCYDQRNSQIYNAMQKRAKSLECRLRLEDFNDSRTAGGAFLDRPPRSLRFLGVLMWHDRGLSIVYAAVFAAWTYLLVNSFLQLAQAVLIKIAVPVIVFLIVLVQLHFNDEVTDTLGALPPRIRQELTKDSTSGAS